MKKQTQDYLLLAGLAVGGFYAFKYYKDKQAQQSNTLTASVQLPAGTATQTAGIVLPMNSSLSPKS